MVVSDLKLLVDRMTEHGRRMLEAAAGLTFSRSHYNVEVEHLLLKLVEDGRGDIPVLLAQHGLDAGRVAAELNRALDRLAKGNARPPSLSPDLVQWLREAWMLASIETRSDRIAGRHLLVAALADERLGRTVREASPSLASLPVEAIRAALGQPLAGIQEVTAASDAGPGAAGTPPGGAAPAEAGARGDGPLAQFCNDLTAQAREGRIDPILGRDDEIRQMVDILSRRRQNNPILTGEPGVGKTAVVEGLALRIAAGDVPEPLKNVRILSLDLGLLQAGAGIKGEFENRLKGVIDAVKASPRPIIVFIDEAHTLIGAGGQAGQNDAANLLKPALARGEMRCIAATTWSEYKKYFEKDAALTRRFQVVKVEEPVIALADAMLRGLVGTLEKHHRVQILDEAVQEAVKLSARFIPSRQLPDKAVSLLDTACSRVAMSQAGEPAAVEHERRQLALLATELAALDREAAAAGSSGEQHEARRAALRAERAETEQVLARVTERWQQERTLVARIGELRAQLQSAPQVNTQAEVLDADRRKALGDELAAARQALRDAQGESPLVHPVVDGAAVAEVVANWTGIPVGRMVADEIRTVLGLRDELARRVVGQDHALEAIAQAIRTSRAGLTDPRKPIGVFLLAGTSGVGKTETALAVADLLYGGEQNLTTINMSEFKEEHKVSLLMGSPPGYVGYGEGGVLTEAVRRRPYSVLLLDEMEKAHPGVQDVFFQVFDKGRMKDGEGRDIDFRNTVIIMTSNAGTDAIAKLCADPDTTPEPGPLREAMQPELLKTFKPALLGRCNVVIYYPLRDEVMRDICRLKLGSIARRIDEHYGVPFTFDDAVVDTIVSRCREVESGARNVDNIISGTLLPQLSSQLLGRMATGAAARRVHVRVEPEQAGFAYELD